MELTDTRSYTLIPYFVMADHRLTYSEKCVYSVVLYLNEAGRGCFASNRYFAERLGLSLSTVSHALTRLERLGYVRRLTDKRTGVRWIELKEGFSSCAISPVVVS